MLILHTRIKSSSNKIGQQMMIYTAQVDSPGWLCTPAYLPPPIAQTQTGGTRCHKQENTFSVLAKLVTSNSLISQHTMID